jgi:hypothetical protein
VPVAFRSSLTRTGKRSPKRNTTDESRDSFELRNDPEHGRPSPIWLGVPVVALVLFAIAAQTPYFLWFRLLFAIGLVVLSALEWRSRGHGWLPTLSWAVPLGSLWIVAQVVVQRPAALAWLAYCVGFGFVLAMLISTRAARWWYEVVLRRSPND